LFAGSVLSTDAVEDDESSVLGAGVGSGAEELSEEQATQKKEGIARRVNNFFFIEVIIYYLTHFCYSPQSKILFTKL
jgi:hypothetical protein